MVSEAIVTWDAIGAFRAAVKLSFVRIFANVVNARLKKLSFFFAAQHQRRRLRMLMPPHI